MEGEQRKKKRKEQSGVSAVGNAGCNWYGSATKCNVGEKGSR
jgi:hypothetical protein